MKMKPNTVVAGLVVGLLGTATGVHGHSLIVDVDVVTPGIQTTISVLPGTVVPVDIHLVDDGTFAPMTGYGIATNYNDTPGALGIFAPTVAGPLAGGVAAPFDLVAGVPTGPGLVLIPAGLPAFGFGPGGPFTATNGGTGYFDGLPPFGPNPPFPLPGFIGGTVVLESITFVALGLPGMSSDIAPLGILAPGPPLGAAPAIGGPFGLEFYDNSAGAPGGLGGYPAIPVGAFGPNPSFPLGSLGLPPVTPGTITIIPEPSGLLIGLLSLGSLLLRRRR
jgi:hypothetical protein